MGTEPLTSCTELVSPTREIVGEFDNVLATFKVPSALP